MRSAAASLAPLARKLAAKVSGAAAGAAPRKLWSGIAVAPLPHAQLLRQRPGAAACRAFSAIPDDALIGCSKVYVQTDSCGGVTAFASAPIRRGDLVERGVARRIDVDGRTCEHMMLWAEGWTGGDDGVWAQGSGCAVCFKAAPSEIANLEMRRNFAEESYELIATRDINADEPLCHAVLGIEHRECFKDIDNVMSLKPTAPELKGESLVDWSRVIARRDTHGGVGVFATTPFRKDEVVERGVVVRLPVDGNDCQYVFTWSEDRTVWATGSGCSNFYNTALDGSENIAMRRITELDRFEYIALRDIEVGEELRHVYKSIEWRACFRFLKEERQRLMEAKRLASAAGAPAATSGAAASVGSAP